MSDSIGAKINRILSDEIDNSRVLHISFAEFAIFGVSCKLVHSPMIEFLPRLKIRNSVKDFNIESVAKGFIHIREPVCGSPGQKVWFPFVPVDYREK